jgi:uncharacterized paraquat-inducible protein A
LVTIREKQSIQGIGVLLIIGSFIAYTFSQTVVMIVIYPHREYAFPLLVLGIIIIVVGYALPLTPPFVPLAPSIGQLDTPRFCTYCGRRTPHEAAQYCPSCGHQLEVLA